MRGIQLGRPFGISISLDWSFVFIFVLVSFNLGAGLFPSWHPEWSAVQSWAVALTAAALFFSSVLVHELSHALVARAFGVPVKSITLFLFGGVANIEHDPESPRAEILIAAVGPVTSFVLGVAFTMVGVWFAGIEGSMDDPLEAIARLGPAATLLLWLGPVNLALAVFNMMPGFPLDGGRVLRGILWRISGDVLAATRWAARAGQIFAWMLITIGVAMMFGVHVRGLGGGLVQGLWLAFIGWFLSGAAAASYRQAILRAALCDVPVTQIMRRTFPPIVRSETSVASVVTDTLLPTGAPVVLVAEDGDVVGLVRAQDVSRVPARDWSSTSVRTISHALASLPTLTVDADAYEVLRAVGRSDVEVAVIVDGTRLAGVIAREDLARWLALQSDDHLRRGGGSLARSGA